MENDPRRNVKIGRLEVAGVALALLGATIISVGWYALADERSVVEQLPYLASGGIGGLALVIAGAAVVHLTRQFRLERDVAAMAANQEELREAVAALAAALAESGAGTGPLTAVPVAGDSPLRASGRRPGRRSRLDELAVTEQPG